jgi:hypothetical protein
MKAYLQTYGHSLYDLDFSKPTPADDPAPILETLKLYLKGGGRIRTSARATWPAGVSSCA